MITVIILLILAGVAMSLITGEGGLFVRVNHSADVYNKTAYNEADRFNELDAYMAIYSGDENIDLIKLKKYFIDGLTEDFDEDDMVWLIEGFGNVLITPSTPDSLVYTEYEITNWHANNEIEQVYLTRHKVYKYLTGELLYETENDLMDIQT